LQFSAPTNYVVETNPVTVAVGDFNGDGKQDLAVLNSASTTVSILLGNGDGTFRQSINVSVGSTAAFIAVGDFNGDHKLDLAVAEGAANTVSILLGKGDGTFEPPVQYNTGIPADYLAVADFNNDKKPDLLVSANPLGTDGSISILLGKGDGSLESPIVTSTGFLNSTPYVAVGDFNGDGKLDVATGNGHFSTQTGTSGNVIILPGNGDGTFRSPVTTAVPFVPHYLTTGDFNRDGKVDLAALAFLYIKGGLFNAQLCAYEDLETLLGNGDGTFRVSAGTSLPHEFNCPIPAGAARNAYAPNVVVADLNNDGKPDLILPVVVPNPSLVGGQHTAIWTFVGNGDGTFQNPQKFTLATTPSWLAVGDFNRGSLPDLAVSSYSANEVGVLLNTTPMTVVPAHSTSPNADALVSALAGAEPSTSNPPPPSCRSFGTACSAKSQCCSGLCSTHGRCCTIPYVGRSCTLNAQCCFGSCFNHQCR
jgi:hypothetical protein